jgi:hypothetical protein
MRKALSLATVMATLSFGGGPAVAQNYPWCAQRGDGAINCGFVSYEQCGASSRFCVRNPMYEPPAEPRSGRRPRGR